MSVGKPSPLAAFALAALSGLAYAASFPPLSWTMAAWLALVPLLVACAGLSPRRAALAGMCWTATMAAGVGWFLPAMLSHYFGLATVPSWLASLAIAVGLHGIYVSSYAAWVAWLVRRRAANPVLVAGGWLVCEFARAHGVLGSPWALTAYSQLGWTPVIQIADLAGPYGIGLLATTTPSSPQLRLPGARWRVLSVGGTDLRGVGPLGFMVRTYAAAGARRDLRVPLVFESRGFPRKTTIHLVPVAFPWRMLPITCITVITGALVLARRPGTRVARAFFLLAVAYGLHWTFFFGGPAAQTTTWLAVFMATSLVMLPLVLRAVLIFPAEVAPPGGRLPWWPWRFGVFGPISSSWLVGVPLPPHIGFRAVFAVNAVFIATVLALLTRNYVRASPVGRRQLKWVLFGFYVGSAPVLLVDVVTTVVPAVWWLHEVAVIAEILIPPCVLIAIVRANYFDVDRLITGAAIYSFLSVLLLAAMLIAVPQLARIASTATGLDPHTVQLVLSIIMAAGIVPGRNFVAPRIEPVLFRERHALHTGVEDLLHDLAAADGPEALLTLAGRRLDALVRPQACLIYAPLGPRFTPVFARSERPDGPETLPADAATVAALRTRTAPLDVERWSAARTQPLPSAERAALERLGAAVLVPVRCGADLATIICLGPKRSGDIYTATDLTLLAAVADKIAGELLRFDAAVILQQEREMGNALRRYVPQPVAARLTRGQAIEGGEPSRR